MQIEVCTYHHVKNLPGFFVKCFIAEANLTKIKKIKIYTN